jgi:hypothetical protein
MGVVLIVALLAWSVNQRVIACTGLQSRAAVVVPAGSPPAPKPEPSPSRHNCCPLETNHTEKTQPSSLPDCKIHASLDSSCCSIAKNPASRLPFQNVSRFELQQFIAVPASMDARVTIISCEGESLAAIVSTPITESPTTVLRL